MTFLWTTLFFVYGLVFGSFFNVVGLRVPKKQSIVSPPSHCTGCDRRLGALDLIPVVSFLFLRGRCKGCGTAISAIYPFMELVTGILFGLSYYFLGFSGELLIALFFMSMLVIITVSDLAYMLIPNKVLLPFAVVLGVLRLIIPLAPWWDAFLGAAVGFGVLLLIMELSKGGMGGGDVKLFFVLGLVLGTKLVLLTLFLASVIGSFVGILFLTKTKQGRKTPIPFGPSIAMAAVLSYFWGADFVSWYSSLFF